MSSGPGLLCARANVLSSAHLHRIGMRFQSFGIRQNLHILTEPLESCRVDCLHADPFHEIVCGKSAPPPRPASGRQHVIASAGVIAKWLRAQRTQENSPGT